MVGRKREMAALQRAMMSGESEFVAIYGRRRIGKTYLVREFFKGGFVFQHTGLEKGDMAKQLSAFRDSLEDCGMSGCAKPNGWMEAFRMLRDLVARSRSKRKVLFIDEMPWMDTPKSDFVSALEHFWNAWMSARKDVILVVCGSATSWIINKVIRSRGGLHNRVTSTIALSPFTLGECELYARERGLSLPRKALAELYMVFGGVAYYWRHFEKGMSVAQIVDRLLFAENAELRGEFDRVFASLFKNDAVYRKIVFTLSKKEGGMSLEELLSRLNVEKGGRWTRRLEELEQCGFVRRYAGWGKKERDARYQLIDNFTLFSMRFLHNAANRDEHFWLHATTGSAIRTWRGLAFERLCLLHVRQIKFALGVSGVLTHEYAWNHRSDGEHQGGAQIDLVIDRADNVVNVCEMKFTDKPFEISKKYATELTEKIETFREVCSVKKSIFLTFVTSTGLADNAQRNMVQSEVTLDDLFANFVE